MVCACLAALTAIALATSPLWKSTSPPPQAEAAQHPADGDVANTEISATVSHPIYQYSVIAGGAHNREELASAIGRDPVVADHYRTISLDRVRVERLREARRAYVSYRVGDRVFWTKHQVTLPAGEPILTDGVKQIRARCGNCISWDPQLPTSDAEPEALEFEALAPPGNQLLPSRAVTHGLMPPPVSPTGLATAVNLGPSLTSGIGESGSRVLGIGTVVNHGIPISVESPVGGSSPGVFSPDGSSPGSSSPRGPGDDILHGPPPGTVTSPETPGVDAFGDDPVQPVPVPEPSTIVLLGTGVAGALWRQVRSRRKP